MRARSPATATLPTTWCRTRWCGRCASEHLFHGGDIRSWLYTILTNLNRNRLRSLSRRPALMPIDENDAPELAGPEAGGRDIERALATLVDEQRAALLLVVLEGLSYREVAAGAGRSDRHRDVAPRARARPGQGVSRRSSARSCGG